MTDFRTIVDVPVPEQKIDLTNKLFLVGSCFTENVGQKLKDSKFQTQINPFGILYNPESIAQCLTMILNEYAFTADDLVEQEGIWNSLYHHSKFSKDDKKIMLEHLNKNVSACKGELQNADFLLITFGTAWVYKYNKTGKVVSNCHKISAKDFNRYRLSVNQIVDSYTSLINSIKEINPNVQIVFTVSPVRHMKDGAIENQLSKSTLILAIQTLLEKMDNLHYFPAYEIVMDDLRDYRFYNNDMVHPSETAVEYLWEKFTKSWISDSAYDFMDEIKKIKRALQHRPFQPKAEAHQRFIKKQLQIIERMQKENPQADFSIEIQAFKKVLE